MFIDTELKVKRLLGTKLITINAATLPASLHMFPHISNTLKVSSINYSEALFDRFLNIV